MKENYFCGRYIGFRLLMTAGLLSAILLMGTKAFAEENPPSEIQLAGEKWTLASSGIRTYAFVDVYQCAVYLDKPGKVEESILEKKQPVAIRIQILTSQHPGHVPDVWKETIESEVSDKIYKRFKKHFLKLEEGDELIFSYIPGQSTRFYQNGKKVFEDSGSGLMQSLLEQWIGKDPISNDLKMALFNE